MKQFLGAAEVDLAVKVEGGQIGIGARNARMLRP
jgi:hypothetical protein